MYLTEIGAECSTEAMNDAADNASLETVIWLHENRDEGCTTKAMVNAALNGHLEVVMKTDLKVVQLKLWIKLRSVVI